MNPTVEAAWIALIGAAVGISAAVLVAIVGFHSTKAATAKTVSAAREQRLWERKADAYQDALAAALYRSRQRRQINSLMSLARYTELAQTALTNQTEQEWNDLMGRLGTFGDPKVTEAYNKALATARLAHQRFTEWRQEVADGGARLDVTPGLAAEVSQTIASAQRAFQAAMDEADTADTDLEHAIRADLHKNDA